MTTTMTAIGATLLIMASASLSFGIGASTVDEEFDRRIQVLENRTAEINGGADQGEAAAPPVGTIIAWAGAERRIEGRTADLQAMFGGYWLPADGRRVARELYPLLADYLEDRSGRGHTNTRRQPADDEVTPEDAGHYFNLPDLRSLFLRGCDFRDINNSLSNRGSTTRSAWVKGAPASGSQSYQGYLTGLPQAPFRTDASGQHSHRIGIRWNRAHTGDGRDNRAFTHGPDYLGGAAAPDFWSYGTDAIEPAGEHTHAVVSGGDKESAPSNVSVVWLIRVK